MKKIQNQWAITLCLLMTILLAPFASQANAVSITNVTVTANDISFDITWKNSWNVTQIPGNHDAVWLFIKYAECVAGVPPVWLHTPLSNISSDHSSGANLIVNAVNDGRGVFLRRPVGDYSLPADIPVTSVTLRLDLPAAATGYNFKVFGVEMVSIPQAPFYIGDGASTSTFTSIQIGNTEEASGIAGGAIYAGSPAVPATYPAGFSPFYCMKYEISQQQYVDFLNALSYDQQVSRTAIAPNTGNPATALDAYAMITGGSIGSAPNPTRNGIRIQAAGDATLAPKLPAVYMNDLNGDRVGDLTITSPDGLTIAANYLSWGDIAAYLDWAALRPMSEMEYEKVCRGTNASIAHEYPWSTAMTSGGGCCTTPCIPLNAGAASVPGLTPANSTTLSNSGLISELSTTNGTSTYQGLCAVGGTGPLRVGFAAKGTTNRISAGAGYYGVLDLGGNVWERIISTDANGVTFAGDSIGNGEIDASGNPDVGTWPTAAAATGTGMRGGSWSATATDLGNYVAINSCMWTRRYRYNSIRISDRSSATTVITTRASDYGGRGVR